LALQVSKETDDSLTSIPETSRDEIEIPSPTEMSPIHIRYHDLAVYQPSYVSAPRVLGVVGVSG
jgi:hypothetical protein